MSSVLRVYCTSCESLLTNRAMAIHLVADNTTKGYSTDIPSPYI